MLKKEMEEKLKKYEEILYEIGQWANPIQYKINEMLSKQKLLFHLAGIQNVLDEKFYITKEQ